MEGILQKICRLITRHRFNRCYAYSEEYQEYYCSCRICHYHFWTSQKPKKLPKEEVEC